VGSSSARSLFPSVDHAPVRRQAVCSRTCEYAADTLPTALKSAVTTGEMIGKPICCVGAHFDVAVVMPSAHNGMMGVFSLISRPLTFFSCSLGLQTWARASSCVRPHIFSHRGIGFLVARVIPCYNDLPCAKGAKHTFCRKSGTTRPIPLPAALSEVAYVVARGLQCMGILGACEGQVYRPMSSMIDVFRTESFFL
jgi:hypothetical protein